MDPATKAQIDRGQRLTEILKQPPYSPVPVELQIVTLWAATNGYLDQIPVEKGREYEQRYAEYLKFKEKALVVAIAKEKVLDEKITEKLEKATKKFTEDFLKTIK